MFFKDIGTWIISWHQLEVKKNEIYLPPKSVICRSKFYLDREEKKSKVFSSPRPVVKLMLRNPFHFTIYPYLGRDRWIHTFSLGISAKGSANSLVRDWTWVASSISWDANRFQQSGVFHFGLILEEKNTFILLEI